MLVQTSQEELGDVLLNMLNNRSFIFLTDIVGYVGGGE